MLSVTCTNIILHDHATLLSDIEASSRLRIVRPCIVNASIVQRTSAAWRRAALSAHLSRHTRIKMFRGRRIAHARKRKLVAQPHSSRTPPDADRDLAKWAEEGVDRGQRPGVVARSSHCEALASSGYAPPDPVAAPPTRRP